MRRERVGGSVLVWQVKRAAGQWRRKTDVQPEGGRSMVGHADALTHGNTRGLGWQAGMAVPPQCHLVPDSPLPCRRRRFRPSWRCVPRKSSSEAERG